MNYFLILVSLFGASLSFGANLPAGHCEIFIESGSILEGSHSEKQVGVVAKVGWIGNGEFIQKVAFYGQTTAQNLGNAPSCGDFPVIPTSDWTFTDPTPVSFTKLGEYAFEFPVASGAVSGPCNGANYSTEGTFFVQTNKNTYWLNPDLNPSKYYLFDGEINSDFDWSALNPMHCQ